MVYSSPRDYRQLVKIDQDTNANGTPNAFPFFLVRIDLWNVVKAFSEESAREDYLIRNGYVGRMVP
jgi:hypothetical protein